MNEGQKHRQNEAVIFAGCILIGAGILAESFVSLVRDSGNSARLHEIHRDWPFYLVAVVLMALGLWGFRWHQRKYRQEDAREQKSEEAMPRPGLLGQGLVVVPTIILITFVLPSSRDGFFENLSGTLFFGITLWILFRVVQKYKN